jgi:prepilin-type processing-associated H-X9-DG protein
MTVCAGLMVPPIIRQSHKDQCVEQLKRLGLALDAYHDAHTHFPAAAITGKDGKPLLSWRVAILPQLGYQSLFDQFHLDEPWDSPHNLGLASQMPALYACPSLSDRRAYVTGYQVVVGPKPELGSIGTLFEWARGVEIREIIDGTSNTVMIVETNRLIPWTQPDDLTFDRDAPLPQLGSRHPGGYHVLFADGLTRFLKDSISPEILRSLLTRDGGEVISA